MVEEEELVLERLESDRDLLTLLCLLSALLLGVEVGDNTALVRMGSLLSLICSFLSFVPLLCLTLRNFALLQFSSTPLPLPSP